MLNLCYDEDVKLYVVQMNPMFHRNELRVKGKEMVKFLCSILINSDQTQHSSQSHSTISISTPTLTILTPPIPIPTILTPPIPIPTILTPPIPIPTILTPPIPIPTPSPPHHPHTTSTSSPKLNQSTPAHHQPFTEPEAIFAVTC
ncbi:hypothetical protein Pmani_031879 [Petrolisthes manimaculis]|uniref:Uncharacterized protein n=1 Tax=Petrolisthes manimaculis TaxID=1843537 RepID=A0AAE1TUC1_9EUCA|nr:hypothetical protein Pmani_031879 [Petrolisthes manimaculis]